MLLFFDKFIFYDFRFDQANGVINMTSSSPSTIIPPDIIHGVSNKTCPLQSSKLNFNPSISSEFQKLKPSVPSGTGSRYQLKSDLNLNVLGFKISPSILSSQRQQNVQSTSNTNSTSLHSTSPNFPSTSPRRQFNIKRKPDFDDTMMNSGCANE